MIYHLRRSHIPLLWVLIIVLISTYCQAAATVDVDLTSRRHVKPILTTRGGSALSLPSWSNKIIAGGTSRAVAQALLYPVDALRTLAQTRDGRTLSDVGSKALLRGCAQTSSFALFTGTFQFGIFGLVNPRCGPLVASACGAAGSCLVSVPQEVIKQRLVTGVYSSFRHALVSIMKTGRSALVLFHHMNSYVQYSLGDKLQSSLFHLHKMYNAHLPEGILGFYSGWKPTMSRNVPFVITTFTSRDILRRKILQYKQQQNKDELANLTSLDDVAIGVLSALIGGVVTQPIDVIKTRMMTQAASTAIPYTSALDCASSILKIEGIRKLYSGFGQRSIYMCGLWGITFGLEPLLTAYLNERSSGQ